MREKIVISIPVTRILIGWVLTLIVCGLLELTRDDAIPMLVISTLVTFITLRWKTIDRR
jgi:hypothetical protein